MVDRGKKHLLIHSIIIRDVLPWLFSLFPLLAVGFLVSLYSVNTPTWDDWKAIILHYIHNDLLQVDFSHLWTLHNEHRIFLPQVFSLALAHLSSANMLYQIYLNFLLVAATAFLLYALFSFRAKSSQYSNIFRFLLFCLIFSLAPWPWWIHTNAGPTQWCVFFFCLALLLLSVGPIRGTTFTCFLLAATGAALSFTPGMLGLWLLFPILYLRGYRSPRYFLIFGVFTLLIYGLYLQSFLSSEAAERTYPRVSLGEYLSFFLVFLGSPLTHISSEFPSRLSLARILGGLAFFFGAIQFLFLRRYWAQIRREAYPWLCLAGWVLLSAVASAYGRCGYLGVSEALTPRYMPFSTIFWVAFTAFTLQTWRLVLLEDTGRRCSCRLYRWLSGGTLAVIFCLWGAVQYRMLQTDFTAEQLRTLQQTDCALNFERSGDRCLAEVYPDVSFLKPLLPELFRRNASLFSGHLFAPQRMSILTGKNPDASSPAPPVFQDDDFSGVTQSKPSTFSWVLYLPKSPSIHLDTEVRISPSSNEESNHPGFLLQSVVISEDRRHLLWKESVTAQTSKEIHQAFSWDLSSFGGETVQLQLNMSADPLETGSSCCRPVRWRLPRLTVR